MVYALPYLFLFPEFDCEDIEYKSEEYYEKCIPSYFCEHVDITWDIN